MRFSRLHLLFLPLTWAGCQQPRVTAPADKAASTSGAAASGTAIEVNGDLVRIADRAPHWKYVQVRTAEAAPPVPPPTAPARVLWDEMRTSAVGSPLAGRVAEVHVRLGDHVHLGRPLFSVRSAVLVDMERDIASNQTRADAARRKWEHEKEMLHLEVGTQRAVVEAEQELAAAEVELQAARTRRKGLQLKEQSPGLFQITAPRAGTVVETGIVADAQVGPDVEHAIVRIANLDEVLVLASVQAIDVAAYPVGRTVTVRTRDGAAFEGRVETVSDVVEVQRRTVEVRIRLSNTGHTLRPNAYVEARPMEGGERPLVRVPTEAVVRDGATPVVFVVTADGRFERRPVKTGHETQGTTEILEGLEPGTPYAAKGALLLLNVVDLAR